MEEKRMIDVDELRKELGFAEMCGQCKRNPWKCQKETYYSNLDFCNRFDIAVDTILERHKEHK